MTRHDMVQASAAGASPPATDPRAPMMTVAADRPTTSNVRGRLNRAEAQRNGLSASTAALASGGSTVADIGRSSKYP